ncbi:MAG TPA: hypothetical protein DIT07_13215, partial [Sphingobacteriaceae bacterium]|nr:hypothetical protein [Sphingobacteriaceae bacterium]
FRDAIHAITNKETETILKESIKGIPSIKYVKEGELSRNFISEEGLVYRNWDLTPGLSEELRESRVKHILKHTSWEHAIGDGSKFAIEEPREVFELIDEAWKLKKENNIPFIVNERGNRVYKIDLGAGRYVGSGKKTAIQIVTKNRDDYDWIVTAFPVKAPK